ncbi:hypothetical protein ACE3IS_05825 [Enterobacter hormaechei subsp. hormaechei]|uniref:hypothetical protein n=1 Tax=Enterobacter hormaechei TaxID=158836 RepID=UPI0035C5D921
MTLTKEWLQQTISELEEERDATPGAVNEDAANALAAMKLALASLEAEPVAYIRDGFRADGVHFCGGIITAEEHERTKPALSDRYTWKHQPLYTAPPASVSVPDEEQCKPHPVMAVKGELGFLDHFDRIISERDEDIDIGQLGSSNYEALMLAALDAFRAAIFQGAELVSNRDELPECLVKAMQAAIEQLDRRAGYIGHGYPQHCHTVRGFWDQGNGSIAHEPCSVCALWDEMRDYLSAAPQQEVK